MCVFDIRKNLAFSVISDIVYRGFVLYQNWFPPEAEILHYQKPEM